MDIYAVICFWALFVFVNGKKDIDYDYLGLAIVGEGKDPPKHTIKKPDGSDIILLRLKNSGTTNDNNKYVTGGPLDKDLVNLEHDLRCGCSANYEGYNGVLVPEREIRNRKIVNSNEEPNGLPVNYGQNFNPVLRNLASGCASKVAGLLCSLRCGTDSAYCSDGGMCYCKQIEARLDINTDNGNDENHADSLQAEYDDRTDVSADYEGTTDSLKSNNDQIENQEFNPALRHHIAHFCPDVEQARNCIRTCMTQGKPAFCGKDHVCYCGHRYNEHDIEPNQVQLDAYKEYKDLYTKYFAKNKNAREKMSAS